MILLKHVVIYETSLFFQYFVSVIESSYLSYCCENLALKLDII